MHDLEFDHIHPSEEQKEQLSDAIWSADNVEFTTVGVDVGSSTSHLMFAKVHLQRLAEALSSRFVVVSREILWKSPILLTPYRPDFTIDAEELGAFIDAAYGQAGITKNDIDSGAVILTGEALKRTNARAIADLFAMESGKFVCASAGHNMEALMAAHGSGAVELSRQEHRTFLNVDIGGGTTKFALVGMSEALAPDLEPHGIGVTVLCPGYVNTSIFKAGRNRPQEYGGPFVRDENSELAAGAKNGMDPNIVGDLIVEAILENKLYVMTHDEERHMVEDRHANIMAAFDEVGSRKS